MNRLNSLLGSMVLILASSLYFDAARGERALALEPQKPKAKAKGGPKHVFTGPPPAHPFDVILGRPTDHSITVSVLSDQDREAYLTCGLDKTEVRKLEAGRPVEFVLDRLNPDSRYAYRLHTRDAKSKEFVANDEQTFQTQRKPGSTFRFAVQADSHLDQGTSPAVYERTLANARADSPDFFVDLGDTFMTDKYPDHHDALPQYLAQRYYLGQIARSNPLFLVLGNHDGERLDRFNGRADSMPAWSCLTRKTYFPNPEPDSFYTGNATEVKPIGRLQNYYAWEWGDALMIALDPFWTTGRVGRDDPSANWSRTLGEPQYRWLAVTLARSKARFKFVFIHHLVGGIDESARGGLEAASLYEWGGKGADGRDEFAKRRPGWDQPIHKLLVQNKVSVVFHGHDHFFARQDLDGVVYLMVPQPGHAGGDRLRSVEEYGYKTGDFLASPGYVRVTVSPEAALVDYIRTTLPEDETAGRKNGRVGYSFQVTR